MELEIQKMSLNDISQLENTLSTDFDDFWSITTLTSEIQNPNSTYLVAKQDSQIVGFGGIWRAVDEVHLTNIVTKKQNRNQGIASHILKQLCLIAKSEHFDSITLEVNENNQSAISLYEKNDFCRIGFRKKYYNNKENAVLMTKSLK